MKITDIITENKALHEVKIPGISSAIEKMLGRIGLWGIKQSAIKNAAERVVEQWAKDIVVAQKTGRNPALSSIDDILKGEDQALIKAVKDADLVKSMEKEANSLATKMLAKAGANIAIKLSKEVISAANFLGIAVPITRCINSIVQDSKELQGPQFETAVQIHLKKCVGEVAAALLAKGTIKYFFKLPAGAQSWFGWLPGFTTITNSFASLGPAAAAAAQSYFLTQPGREMIAEYFVSNAFAAEQAEWLRRIVVRYMMDNGQGIINKLQDFGDPAGATSRSEVRKQQAAGQSTLQYDPFNPANYQGTNTLKYDAQGNRLN